MIGEATKLSFDHGEVHDLSVSMLKLLADKEADVGTGALASFLTVGRLLAQYKLDENSEVDWLQSAMEFAGAYWADGEAN